MVIKNLNLYSNKNKSFYLADIKIEDGIIAEIGSIDAADAIDGKGAYVVPGLIDVHTHGISGGDWSLAEGEELYKMAAAYAQNGVTTVMPTLGTDTYENMLLATDRVTNLPQKDGCAFLCGMHWEGRYLNIKKKGAHLPELIVDLDPADLDSDVLRSCSHLHISAAYELDADGEFIKKALEIGATCGLAHTMATYKEAKLAESRGVSSYTHLYNAMPPLHHRDGGCIAAAFEGDAIAELICDGVHVSEEMVRLAYRNLGAQRLSLVSDSLLVTGVSDGVYESLGLRVTVKNGECRLDDGTLAGSTLTLDKAVRNLMSFCRIPLTEAIISATETPARQVGIFGECGSIDVGKRADMLLLTNGETLDVDRVMVRGSFIN